MEKIKLAFYVSLNLSDTQVRVLRCLNFATEIEILVKNRHRHLDKNHFNCFCFNMLPLDWLLKYIFLKTK